MAVVLLFAPSTMDPIKMFAPRMLTSDTAILPAYFPVPLLGLVPVNAFVIGASEPVLVDTGLIAVQDDFMRSLRMVLDPAALRWIYLTHVDNDHIGSLERLLVEAPNARIITTFLGLGKYSLRGALPPERVFLLNPGQTLDVGDRTLVVLKPPTFDSPETTAVFDTKSKTLFSSDCFGGVVQRPADDAAALGSHALREGCVLWTRIDSPWLHTMEQGAFNRSLAAIRELQPKLVLSSHLPPAYDMLETLLTHLVTARAAVPWVGPDQATLMAAMAPT
ncbi:MAG: oxygen-binding di-iron domain-containing protein, partial [Polyangiales bacterium]